MSIEQVDDNEIITIGDKVDLVTQAGLVYRTMIEDRLDGGLFLAGVPIRKGAYMRVEQEDDLYMVFYRDSGRYIAQMKVVSLEKRGAVRYMWMAQKTGLQKNQRRAAFRLPVSFDVKIYEYMEDIGKAFINVQDEVKAIALEVVKSKDISITGIALMTKRRYQPGDRYLLGLQFNKISAGMRQRSPVHDRIPSLHLAATVKRCVQYRTSSTYNTGMQFFGMTDNVMSGIAKYVVTEQQRQLNKKRSV